MRALPVLALLLAGCSAQIQMVVDTVNDVPMDELPEGYYLEYNEESGEYRARSKTGWLVLDATGNGSKRSAISAAWRNWRFNKDWDERREEYRKEVWVEVGLEHGDG